MIKYLIIQLFIDLGGALGAMVPWCHSEAVIPWELRQTQEIPKQCHVIRCIADQLLAHRGTSAPLAGGHHLPHQCHHYLQVVPRSVWMTRLQPPVGYDIEEPGWMAINRRNAFLSSQLVPQLLHDLCRAPEGALWQVLMPLDVLTAVVHLQQIGAFFKAHPLFLKTLLEV